MDLSSSSFKTEKMKKEINFFTFSGPKNVKRKVRVFWKEIHLAGRKAGTIWTSFLVISLNVPNIQTISESLLDIQELELEKEV